MQGSRPASPSPSPSSSASVPDVAVDIDLWHRHGFPLSVSACVVACSKGVKRAHLLDARLDGGLLLVRGPHAGAYNMLAFNICFPFQCCVAVWQVF